MPPSPRLKVSLVEDRFNDLCARLGIDPPPVRFIPGARQTQKHGLTLWGRADVLTGITIYLNIETLEVDRLRYVSRELVETLLHELRHMYQYETWAPERIDADRKRPYQEQEMERDAEAFAKSHLSEWRGIVRVSRTQPSSPFSKLACHDRRQMV